MRKKVIGLTLGVFLVALYSASEAKQPTRVPRIGFLSSADNRFTFDRFHEGLRDLGYVEGKNIIIDYQSEDRKADRPNNSTECAGASGSGDSLRVRREW
jgi:putative ABC transport system substrate-binding protein